MPDDSSGWGGHTGRTQCPPASGVPVRLRYTLWLGYWILLAAATHIPRQAMPDIQRRGLDKLAHVGVFTVFGALGAWARGPRSARQYAELLALAAAYAAADELTQPWIGRHAEWADWLADLAGSALGLTAYRLRGH